MNRPITSKEIESVIKNLLTNKTPGAGDFIGKFYPTFKEELMPILLIFSKGNWRGENTSKYILWGQHYPITKPDKNTTRKETYRPILVVNIDAKILNKY